VEGFRKLRKGISRTTYSELPQGVGIGLYPARRHLFLFPHTRKRKEGRLDWRLGIFIMGGEKERTPPSLYSDPKY